MPYMCPVCGFPDLYEPPRTEGCGGSYEICPCCGFQFGVTDDDLEISYEQWRQQWIEGGMVWWSPSRKPPPGWDPVEQLRNLSKGK
ncbi:conserved protein of unknown function [Methylacidimicrobium sp. AP8]|nr:conserved protein of unknown function [Methylacidimicrobium sp. AP8]